MAYLKAIQAGDVRTARAACTGASQQMKWVNGRATFVDGMRRFDQALYAKFGNVTSQVHVDMHDSLLKVSDIWVTCIDGGKVVSDTETARIDPARAGFFGRGVLPIFLLHTKDGWKVDLAQTYANGSSPQEIAQLSADMEQWRKSGEVFLYVARNIMAGQYRTADAAAQDLGERLAKLNGLAE